MLSLEADYSSQLLRRAWVSAEGLEIKRLC